MKDTYLKHLTLKTAFLLALASGKHRSEIYAWVANKVSNLGQSCLIPLFRFHIQKPTSKRRFSSVSPVTIPKRVSTPSFISFKKGHTSDIRPTTLFLSKQTIPLCYKQADQQPWTWSKLKHDIRAFTASKAFYGGISVDQIMQACHWKAHTLFYLKDLTWSDNNNMYLGPVVAVQQVLDPSPQHTHLREEKGEGGVAHPLQPSLQESTPGSRYWLPLQMFTVRFLIFLTV